MKFRSSILIMCGDVQLSPGPCRFPWGICNKPAKSNQKAIQCDFCDTWYHIRCTYMDRLVYEAPANSSCIWVCDNCGIANFSSSLLDSLDSVESFSQFFPSSDMEPTSTSTTTGLSLHRFNHRTFFLKFQTHY